MARCRYRPSRRHERRITRLGFMVRIALWSSRLRSVRVHANIVMNYRGPLLFSLLLSFLLSINAREDQRSLVFSGVFATVWIAEAIVTFQIKLLGGNMYVTSSHLTVHSLTTAQFLLPIHLYNRLHTIPTCHCSPAFGCGCTVYVHQNTRLLCPWAVVTCSGCQHLRWKRCREESCGARGISALCVLHWARLPVLHFVALACTRYGISAILDSVSITSFVRRSSAFLSQRNTY